MKQLLIGIALLVIIGTWATETKAHVRLPEDCFFIPRLDALIYYPDFPWTAEMLIPLQNLVACGEKLTPIKEDTHEHYRPYDSYMNWELLEIQRKILYCINILGGKPVFEGHPNYTGCK